MRTLVSFAAVAAVVFGLAVAATPGLGQDAEPPKTVTAQRYRIAVYESALDMTHAHGRKIVELWFPESGIVCNVAGTTFEPAMMNAFYGESRHGLPDSIVETAREAGAAVPEPPDPEEIQVPRALFERIRGLADLTRERARKAQELRKDLEATDLFRAP